jgi:hypothetical protein
MFARGEGGRNRGVGTTATATTANPDSTAT